MKKYLKVVIGIIIIIIAIALVIIFKPKPEYTLKEGGPTRGPVRHKTKET